MSEHICETSRCWQECQVQARAVARELKGRMLDDLFRTKDGKILPPDEVTIIRDRNDIIVGYVWEPKHNPTVHYQMPCCSTTNPHCRCGQSWPCDGEGE